MDTLFIVDPASADRSAAVQARRAWDGAHHGQRYGHIALWKAQVHERAVRERDHVRARCHWGRCDTQFSCVALRKESDAVHASSAVAGREDELWRGNPAACTGGLAESAAQGVLVECGRTLKHLAGSCALQ